MKKILEKYRLEAAAAVMLIIYLIQYIPLIDDTISWCITPYTLSYKYGFISRGLVGSVIRLFIPDLTIKHIYLIIGINTVIMCMLTVYFISVIKRNVNDAVMNVYMYLAMLFIVNPGSVAFLFYWGNYGRFDLFMVCILLISSILIIRNRILWIIPFLSVAGILIHQAYVFMYFPALIVLLLYSGYVKNSRYARKIFWITGVTTCIAFLYMQFFSGVAGYGYEEMMADIYATTDIPEEFITNDMMVRLEYFASVFSTIKAFVIEPIGRNLFKIAWVFILCSPMLVLFKNIWKDFMSKQQCRLLWIIPWSGMIGMIPKFLMTNDYGRDFSALIISQFVMMFVLLAMGDKGMRYAFERLYERIKKNPAGYIFMLVYMGSLGKFEAANILETAHRIYKFAAKIIGIA